MLFQFFLKYESIASNPSLQIQVNKIKKKIAFKTKTGYKLELLSPETTKPLESTKKDVDQDKDGEDVPKLDRAKVFQYTVIYSITIINKHQKIYSALYQINNLDS